MLAQSVNHVTLDTSSSPTKSERDSANTKLYKHTQTLTLRKAGGIVRIRKHIEHIDVPLRKAMVIMRKRRSRWGAVSAVKALLLYYEHHFVEC